MLKWEKIVVRRTKLLDYLLSTTHLVGRSKAKFFRGQGFDESSVDFLAKSLVEIAHSGDLKEKTETPYGTKYVIDGILDSPGGKQVMIRTIWIEAAQKRILEVVTAYPAK